MTSSQLPDEILRHVDTIADLQARGEMILSHEAFVAVTSWCEENYGDICIPAAVQRQQMVVSLRQQAWQFHDDAILIENADIDHEQITDQMRLDWIDRVVMMEIDQSWTDDTDEHTSVDVAELLTSRGQVVFLGFFYKGIWHDEPDITWIGVFNSPSELRPWLQAHGYITSREELEAIPPAEKLRHWAH